MDPLFDVPELRSVRSLAVFVLFCFVLFFIRVPPLTSKLPVWIPTCVCAVCVPIVMIHHYRSAVGACRAQARLSGKRATARKLCKTSVTVTAWCACSKRSTGAPSWQPSMLRMPLWCRHPSWATTRTARQLPGGRSFLVRLATLTCTHWLHSHSVFRHCVSFSPVVFRRSFFYKLREPTAVMTQFVNSVFLSIIIGFIYWQMNDGQAATMVRPAPVSLLPHAVCVCVFRLALTEAPCCVSPQDRVAAVSFVVMCQSFLAIDLIILFPIERAVYLRDQVGVHVGRGLQRG